MWECKQCGTCCKMAGLLIKEWDRGDGGCKNLKEDNTCLIYNIRPEICRVKKDFYTENQINSACSFLRKIYQKRNEYVKKNIKSDS